jgi:hypothetical protein
MVGIPILPERQLAELLRNGLVHDGSKLGCDRPEKLLLQLRGDQLQNPGIRLEISGLERCNEQGVAIGIPEPFRRWLECSSESIGSDAGDSHSIAYGDGDVIEVGAAGRQVFDSAGDGGHR